MSDPQQANKPSQRPLGVSRLSWQIIQQSLRLSMPPKGTFSRSSLHWKSRFQLPYAKKEHIAARIGADRVKDFLDGEAQFSNCSWLVQNDEGPDADIGKKKKTGGAVAGTAAAGHKGEFPEYLSRRTTYICSFHGTSIVKEEQRATTACESAGATSAHGAVGSMSGSAGSCRQNVGGAIADGGQNACVVGGRQNASADGGDGGQRDGGSVPEFCHVCLNAACTHAMCNANASSVPSFASLDASWHAANASQPSIVDVGVDATTGGGTPALAPTECFVASHASARCSQAPEPQPAAGQPSRRKGVPIRRKVDLGESKKRGCQARIVVNYSRDNNEALVYYDHQQHTKQDGGFAHARTCPSSLNDVGYTGHTLSGPCKDYILGILLNTGCLLSNMQVVLKVQQWALSEYARLHNMDLEAAESLFDLDPTQVTDDYCVDEADVDRLKTKLAELDFMKDRDVANSVDKWVKENPQKVIHYQPYEPGVSSFQLVMQTEWMRDRLIEFGHGKPLFMDGTFGVNSQKNPLTTVMVQDAFDHGIPTAFSIMEGGCAEKHYAVLLECLYNAAKAVEPDWLPSSIMIDDCDAEINAITSVFPASVKVVLCTWHVMRSWKKNIIIQGVDKDQVASIFEDLCKNVMYCEPPCFVPGVTTMPVCECGLCKPVEGHKTKRRNKGKNKVSAVTVARAAGAQQTRVAMVTGAAVAASGVSGVVVGADAGGAIGGANIASTSGAGVVAKAVGIAADDVADDVAGAPALQLVPAVGATAAGVAFVATAPEAAATEVGVTEDAFLEAWVQQQLHAFYERWEIKGGKFNAYLQKHWEKKLPMWVKALKRWNTANQQTNNYCEAFHSMLKELLGQKKKYLRSRRIDWLLHVLLANVEARAKAAWRKRRSGRVVNRKHEIAMKARIERAIALPDSHVAWVDQQAGHAVVTSSQGVKTYAVRSAFATWAHCACEDCKYRAKSEGIICKHIIKLILMSGKVTAAQLVRAVGTMHGTIAGGMGLIAAALAEPNVELQLDGEYERVASAVDPDVAVDARRAMATATSEVATRAMSSGGGDSAAAAGHVALHSSVTRRGLDVVWKDLEGMRDVARQHEGGYFHSRCVDELQKCLNALLAVKRVHDHDDGRVRPVHSFTSCGNDGGDNTTKRRKSALVDVGKLHRGGPSRPNMESRAAAAHEAERMQAALQQDVAPHAPRLPSLPRVQHGKGRKRKGATLHELQLMQDSAIATTSHSGGSGGASGSKGGTAGLASGSRKAGAAVAMQHGGQVGVASSSGVSSQAATPSRCSPGGNSSQVANTTAVVSQGILVQLEPLPGPSGSPVVWPGALSVKVTGPGVPAGTRTLVADTGNGVPPEGLRLKWLPSPLAPSTLMPVLFDSNDRMVLAPLRPSR